MQEEAHYKFLLELMSHAALFKLKLNQHRGDINKMTVEQALGRARAELTELEELFTLGRDGNSLQTIADPEAVLLEVADVTNFLLVVAAKAYEAKKEKTVVQYQ